MNAGFGQLESPFEEEVYQVLADEFGEEMLIPQMQFAGFRIDIVFNSKRTDAPKIAIECDGAKYHSSREAYLHDIYRQKILERHGFIFHRIWSTNWWRNAKREANQLISFIKNAETVIVKKMKDESAKAHAFNDKIEVNIYPSKLTLFDDINEVATIKSFHAADAQPSKQVDPNAIRMFSKVKIRYVNNGKDMNVIIGDSYQRNEVSNNVQRLNYKSPLASSILGHSVGDIVKVGDLDNFVEIMEVANQ